MADFYATYRGAELSIWQQNGNAETARRAAIERFTELLGTVCPSEIEILNVQDEAERAYLRWERKLFSLNLHGLERYVAFVRKMLASEPGVGYVFGIRQCLAVLPALSRRLAFEGLEAPMLPEAVIDGGIEFGIRQIWTNNEDTRTERQIERTSVVVQSLAWLATALTLVKAKVALIPPSNDRRKRKTSAKRAKSKKSVRLSSTNDPDRTLIERAWKSHQHATYQECAAAIGLTQLWNNRAPARRVELVVRAMQLKERREAQKRVKLRRASE